MSDLPRRPRLADHVLPRLHRAEGRDLVALIDERSGEAWRVGPREWVLLAMADGTRDLEGVLLAGAREGASVGADALRDFLGRLDAAGLLADGPSPSPDAPTPRGEDVADALARPLDPLPGYGFTCDGRGACCRQYATVVFSGLEVARARAHLPLVERGGDRMEWAFAPRHGSAPGAAWAVKHVDGACAYLDARGLCGIHAAGGAAAKPLGCSLYPARFVDDGEAVRVSPLVECACVVRSAGSPGGAPLVDASARARRDLPAGAWVESLPASVELAAGASVARAAYVAWSRAVAVARFEDAAAWLWAAAEHVDASGALPPPDAELDLDGGALGAWLAALGDVAAKVAVRVRAWRGGRDLVPGALDAVHEALAAMADDPGLAAAVLHAGPAQPATEAIYVRAAAHGHHWVTGRPLAAQLRNVAMRLLAARALARSRAAGALEGDHFDEPVALVEALCRGYGIVADAPAIPPVAPP